MPASFFCWCCFFSLGFGQTAVYISSQNDQYDCEVTTDIGPPDASSGKSSVASVTVAGLIVGPNCNLQYDWHSNGMDSLISTAAVSVSGSATINIDPSWSAFVSGGNGFTHTMIAVNNGANLSGTFNNVAVGTSPSCVSVTWTTSVEYPAGSSTTTSYILTFSVAEDTSQSGCGSSNTTTITATVAGVAILLVIVVVIILCVKQSMRRKKEASNLSKTTNMSATLVEPPPEAVKAAMPVAPPGDSAGSWKIGDFCLAAWSEDGQWYRGQLQQWDPVRGAWLCLFSDYGNQDWVKPADLLPDESRQRV